MSKYIRNEDIMLDFYNTLSPWRRKRIAKINSQKRLLKCYNRLAKKVRRKYRLDDPANPYTVGTGARSPEAVAFTAAGQVMRMCIKEFSDGSSV